MKNNAEIKNYYNTIVIGGGIVGAGIFRDLSLHNVETLLLEKDDFASQTSSRSSKMLHGGIRYLENLDFSLVKEALFEKNLWLQLAPQFTQEKKFILPVYKDSERSRYEIWAGVILYDLLSNFSNSSCQLLGKSAVLSKAPLLKSHGLVAAGVYADAIVDDCALTKAIINDGVKKYNTLNNININNAHNYVETLDFKPFIKNNQRGLLVKILYKKQIQELFCHNLVVATGPFTDQFLASIKCLNWKNCLLPSKGSHLWIKKERFNIISPVVLTPRDGRVIFVIPHQDKILVGTTETQTTQSFRNIEASEVEILYLLENINNFFPTLKLTIADVQDSFAGIRPLVREDNNSSLNKTSRHHKIFYPLTNLSIIVGGKYTTFRSMSQEISKKIVLNNNLIYNKNLSIQKL